MESELESLLNRLFGKSSRWKKGIDKETRQMTIYSLLYLIGFGFFLFLGLNALPGGGFALFLIMMTLGLLGAAWAFAALFVFISGLPSLIPAISNTATAIIVGLVGLISLGIGLLIGNGLGIAFGLIGGFVFFGAFLIPRSKTPAEIRELMRLARKFAQSRRISGKEYSRFIVTLEKAFRLGLVTYYHKRQIKGELHRLMLKQQPRISGNDYVELEKELQRNRETIISDERVEIFSEQEIEQVLENYEKLREKIRDKRLEGKIEPS